MKKTIIIALAFQIVAMAAAPLAWAQTQPSEDINSTGFKLSVCDGPDLSGLKETITVTVNGTKVPTTPGQNPPGYVVCDYYGFVTLAQHVINIMIIVGVLAAMILMAFTGYLYITGTPSKIERAKSIFPKIVWGFILMLTAWFIVFQLLSWLTPNAANYLAK